MPPSASPQQAPKQAAAPVMAPWPFPVGVLDTQNASDYDQTKTMTTGTVQYPDVQVQPDGWTRGIWFDVNGVDPANARHGGVQRRRCGRHRRPVLRDQHGAVPRHRR